ncbi:MAG: UDP-N-acetylmuramoyl-L-alanine--D-glutamate ligase [Rickettsiales bacterium]|nr:UDP-N-acetylmuramoyl-L-alanine--D-glutamate ligase [Rickettsiales bacterium]|tara:strand:+ start:5315 stop:6490 length:1176 start_codon:yes stop_codon:yes gene_type:complete
MTIKQIAVLGDGITGSAVKKKAEDLNYIITSPEEADIVVTSPGIPPEKYEDYKNKVISEIEFSYQLFQDSGAAPFIIAVTGTNGKSTVTSLISHILDIPASGNIGVPLINYVGLEQIYPEIAVEVSSYQLETCVTFKPNIAIILNITPDHLRRHGSMDEYMAQKAKCHQAQTASDILIYNEDDPLVCDIVEDSLAQTIPFSLNDIDKDIVEACHLPGQHNQLNVVAAVKACEIVGKSKHYALTQLQQFKGLKHRLETVGKIGNRYFINDSKSTNPDSTLKAIESIEGRFHVILCGEDKGFDFYDMLRTLHKRAESAIVFGEISTLIHDQSFELDSDFPLTLADTVDDAVNIIFSKSKPNDTILFSPSSSSYDQFKGFEDRGNQFKNCVERL